jgi:pheromone shutdown-related protein TraB
MSRQVKNTNTNTEIVPEHLHINPSFGKNVVHLQSGDRDYYLIGTAHISKESTKEVEEIIAQVNPDTVCVELCQTRYQALTNQDRWKNLNIFEVIKEGKMLFLLASLAIGAYQRRLGQELGIDPGTELLTGISKAKEIGAEFSLIDRDIQITLKRTWSNLSFWQQTKLFAGIIKNLISTETITAEQIEQLKDKDQLSKMMAELASIFPKVQKPLIDERDQYLMSSIEEAPGKVIVAVVGAGHIEGMQDYFGKQVDKAALNQLPKPSRWKSALKWIIPLVVLAAFSFGMGQGGGQTFEELLYAWILPNSILAGIFTMIGRAKPLSVLAAFVFSPITSINPLIGSGMIVGLTEAWLRKPTVADCERINHDVRDLKGIYRNPFTRVLLVAALANTGSILGAWIGASWVLSIITLA